MGQIVKSYLGIFLMMFLCVIGIGLISTEVQICKARDFKTDAVTALENSNYNQGVIDAWKNQAEEAGYQLEVKEYGDTEGTKMAEVVLTYSYQISPFHEEETHCIRGYVR